MSKTIVFFGNERLATGVGTTAPTLRALIDAGYQVAAVVVAQAETGASRQPRKLEVAEVAAEHGIPVLTETDNLAALGAQAGVLVAYGKLIPPTLLDLFPRGIANIHPSLLPLHRGPTPLESVILEGAAETGVSLMRLSPEMDAGPLFVQEKVGLNGHETKQQLADKLIAVGARLVVDSLAGILDGSLEPRPQDEAAATYDKQIAKEDGVLDFNKPAIRLEREVRAYQGWPRSRTKLGDIDVVITTARVAGGSGEPGSLHIDGSRLGVYTSDGLLLIESLIPAGKKEMPAAAFLAGYRPV